MTFNPTPVTRVTLLQDPAAQHPLWSFQIAGNVNSDLERRCSQAQKLMVQK